MMQTDDVIGQLVAGLRPVHRRTMGSAALVLGLLLGAELGLMALAGAVRPDMPEAVTTASFWWKLVSLGALAVLGGGAALLSLNPTRSPRAGLRWMVPAVVACLAAGWGIDAAHQSWPAVPQRLDWRSGVQCSQEILALSAPAAIAFALIMRRGAPVDANGSAWAAGLAAAAFGSFAFVFACPYDDPLYVVVWYGLACGLVAIMARLMLPRLTRW